MLNYLVIGIFIYVYLFILIYCKLFVNMFLYIVHMVITVNRQPLLVFMYICKYLCSVVKYLSKNI